MEEMNSPAVLANEVESSSWRTAIAPAWHTMVRHLEPAAAQLSAQVILGVVGHLLRTTPNQALRNMLPQRPLEIGIYLLLALTAGFCEEVIFRGYLQRQFGALTKSAAGGIVLQAIAFGAGHGYQGWRYMVVITVFGSMFGVLAYWRRSLRPGMIAHFVQDGVGGVVGGRFLR